MWAFLSLLLQVQVNSNVGGCAGHSLGGVMAVLSAMDIADLLPWASLQVYTFGAPRPGNKAFSKMYNSKVPDTWHILNEKVRFQIYA